VAARGKDEMAMNVIGSSIIAQKEVRPALTNSRKIA
jgi:hypothetical protein